MFENEKRLGIKTRLSLSLLSTQHQNCEWTEKPFPFWYTAWIHNWYILTVLGMMAASLSVSSFYIKCPFLSSLSFLVCLTKMRRRSKTLLRFVDMFLQQSSFHATESYRHGWFGKVMTTLSVSVADDGRLNRLLLDWIIGRWTRSLWVLG